MVLKVSITPLLKKSGRYFGLKNLVKCKCYKTRFSVDLHSVILQGVILRNGIVFSIILLSVILFSVVLQGGFLL